MNFSSDDVYRHDLSASVLHQDAYQADKIRHIDSCVGVVRRCTHCEDALNQNNLHCDNCHQNANQANDIQQIDLLLADRH